MPSGRPEEAELILEVVCLVIHLQGLLGFCQRHVRVALSAQPRQCRGAFILKLVR